MQTTILRYRILINKEGKQYVAYVPTLGISDFGKTIDETKKHIEEAIACHIEGLIKTGDDVPAPDITEFLISESAVSIKGNFHFAS